MPRHTFTVTFHEIHTVKVSQVPLTLLIILTDCLALSHRRSYDQYALCGHTHARRNVHVQPGHKDCHNSVLEVELGTWQCCRRQTNKEELCEECTSLKPKKKRVQVALVVLWIYCVCVCARALSDQLGFTLLKWGRAKVISVWCILIYIFYIILIIILYNIYNIRGLSDLWYSWYAIECYTFHMLFPRII